VHGKREHNPRLSMYYLGNFYHKKKNVSFFGQYFPKENIVYPIESIFYPNKTGAAVSFNELKPILCIQPSKIVCIGKNYKDHVKEFDAKVPTEPIIFLKSPTSIIGPEEKIILPKDSNQVDYEGEIAIVIKKECYNVKEKNSLDYILGFTCANDVTSRDLQKKDGQWSRAKGFKTFCPIGPWILPFEVYPKYNSLKIKTFVNGKLKQDGKASSMIFNIPFIISFISKVFPLFPGDIILTGTPSGVGQLKRNNKVVIEIDRIGILTNRVM
jgi:2-keto-4-pentenoate hydratase/2-oxohepta-3-ene-1,7-dioic acid hydratase in catechol pathway